MSFGQFVELVSRKIREYSTNPARNWPNARTAGEYFTNRSAGDMAYQRGMLMALNWNAAIRQVTGGRQSLDDLMRTLVRGPEPLSTATIAAELRRIGVTGAETDLQHWVEAGETIEVRADALGPGAEKTSSGFRVRLGAVEQDCVRWFR